jgi:hypothetical protein
MKDIKINESINKIFKKFSVKKFFEVLLIIAFASVATYFFWMLFDIEKKTSDENVPSSGIIPEEDVIKFKRINSKLEEKTKDKVEEEGNIPRNSFH